MQHKRTYSDMSTDDEDNIEQLPQRMQMYNPDEDEQDFFGLYTRLILPQPFGGLPSELRGLIYDQLALLDVQSLHKAATRAHLSPMRRYQRDIADHLHDRVTGTMMVPRLYRIFAIVNSVKVQFRYRSPRQNAAVCIAFCFCFCRQECFDCDGTVYMPSWIVPANNRGLLEEHPSFMHTWCNDRILICMPYINQDFDERQAYVVTKCRTAFKIIRKAAPIVAEHLHDYFTVENRVALV
jgi:hypothetical protein